MLAGVGGKTIAEAKSNLSYLEANQWLAYIKENGSIAPARIYDRILDRLEFTSAKICWVVARSNGAKNAKIEDFMPKKREVEDDKPADIKSVFNLLKVCAKV